MRLTHNYVFCFIEAVVNVAIVRSPKESVYKHTSSSVSAGFHRTVCVLSTGNYSGMRSATTMS